ncbi:MAG: di-heme oxidoredictase family protein [Gammaproteobacteria bacterium]
MRRRNLSRLVAASAAALAIMSGCATRAGRATDGVSDATAEMEQFAPIVPLPNAQSIGRYERGRALMQQVWQIAPGKDAQHDGLGPLFNAASCQGCHSVATRRQVPENAGDRLLSALVRVSVRQDGDTLPHPAYGAQLNEHSIVGVPAEARIQVLYVDRMVELVDGTPVWVREPELVFHDPRYGALDRGVVTSLRAAPPIMGTGLLDLVPEEVLLEYADPDDRNRDGIAGRPNRVLDEQSGHHVIGRLGWKANSPDLRAQIATALHEDMGLTSVVFPQSACTRIQTECLHAPSGGDPEVTAAMLDDLTFFLTWAAPPARRHADDAETRRGEALFHSTGCAACHRETLTTGENARYAALSRLEFHPYTDLLLHDLGAGLADGRPDHEASGGEWRTPPLWGLGLAQAANPTARFLHDGRARTLTEAILWHAGEAQKSRDRFRAMSGADRAALLRFLDSL